MSGGQFITQRDTLQEMAPLFSGSVLFKIFRIIDLLSQHPVLSLVSG